MGRCLNENAAVLKDKGYGLPFRIHFLISITCTEIAEDRLALSITATSSHGPLFRVKGDSLLLCAAKRLFIRCVIPL